MKKIVLKVNGMMCAGCENRIKNAISLIDGVEEVFASHVDSTVNIAASDDVDINVVKEAIEDLGFEIIEG